MAIKKMNGHAVTSVLPEGADATRVAPANVQFHQAPSNQSGGNGGPKTKKVNPTGAGPNLNVRNA